MVKDPKLIEIIGKTKNKKVMYLIKCKLFKDPETFIWIYKSQIRRRKIK